MASARELAIALDREAGTAAQSEGAAWLRGLCGDQLSARARRLQALQEQAENDAEL